MKKVYVITGASSGIGYETAKLIASFGHIVYSFSRSKTQDENINFVYCDVTKTELVEKAFKEVFEKEGRIDCVVNNAGMGISGPAEYVPSNDVQRIIDVNFSGAIDVASKSIPYLRESKGCLVNISSIAGVFAIPFQAHYSATKAGLLNFSSALKNELRPLGVKVTCLLPCDTKTGFTASRLKTETDTNQIYASRVSKSVNKMEKDEQQGMSATKVAQAIYNLSNKKNPPVVKTMGGVYKLLMFLKRLVPQKFINFIIYQIYGK